MSATTIDDDLAFDFDLSVDAAEYSRIMRRIGRKDGEVVRVSAFNSSI